MSFRRLGIYHAANSSAPDVGRTRGGLAEPWHPTQSWDNQAKVWYVSETNFPGLVAEACTSPELLTKLERLAPKLFGLDLQLLKD